MLNSARDDVFRKEDLFMQVKDRLFEALSNQIEGDVLASDLSRSLYSSGASLYRIKPRAIVQPRSTNDLVATCASCRSYCPMASSHLEEWAKGRGKVNLCRELMSGKLDPGILEDPAFKKIIDSCINCKRCLTECPSGVDVPWLSVTGRSDVVRRKGEDFSSRVLTDTATLCRQGSIFSPVANLATSLAPVRWGLQKAIGLEATRYLPQFRNRTLRKILEERKHHDTTREVVFFLGCFANYNSHEDLQKNQLCVNLFNESVNPSYSGNIFTKRWKWLPIRQNPKISTKYRAA